MKIPRIFTILFLTTFCFGAIFGQAPKGHLVIIGGGNRIKPIMDKIVELAGGPNAVIALLPMASSYADSADYEREMREEFTGYGVKEFRFLNIKRPVANDEATVRKFDGVTGVFFGGGDQAILTAAIGGTPVEKRIHELYQQGAVISGTSAGAAVMSKIMITGDERRPDRDSSFNKIEADNIITKEGFAFMPDVIIDQHFVKRRRHNRLLSLVVENPKYPGIAIDEATSIWVKPDRTFEVIGASCVIIYDGTNALTVRDEKGYGLRASGITTHILRSGSQYDLKTRTVIRLQP
jgi:cyanophycinase